MLAAARALADFTTPEQIEQGQIYPEAKDLRACAATVRHLEKCHYECLVCVVALGKKMQTPGGIATEKQPSDEHHAARCYCIGGSWQINHQNKSQTWTAETMCSLGVHHLTAPLWYISRGHHVLAWSWQREGCSPL